MKNMKTEEKTKLEKNFGFLPTYNSLNVFIIREKLILL